MEPLTSGPVVPRVHLKRGLKVNIFQVLWDLEYECSGNRGFVKYKGPGAASELQMNKSLGASLFILSSSEHLEAKLNS